MHPPLLAWLLLSAGRGAQKALRFRPPARVEVVGSYALRAAARPRLAVDVAVEAPAACFDEKDQLNNRYFARRWRWLAALAGGLQRRAAFRRQRWEFLDGDARCARRAGVVNAAVPAARMQVQGRRPSQRSAFPSADLLKPFIWGESQRAAPQRLSVHVRQAPGAGHHAARQEGRAALRA